MARYVRKLYGGLVLGSMALIKAEFPDAKAYLVGSSLHSETRPRDVDVRIVLPDETFCARYDVDDAHRFWFAGENVTWPRSSQWWAWYDEQQRMETFLSYACGERNVDLWLAPQCMFDHYEGDPKELLFPPALSSTP